jgi:hypothetical protein
MQPIASNDRPQALVSHPGDAREVGAASANDGHGHDLRVWRSFEIARASFARSSGAHSLRIVRETSGAPARRYDNAAESCPRVGVFSRESEIRGSGILVNHRHVPTTASEANLAATSLALRLRATAARPPPGSRTRTERTTPRKESQPGTRFVIVSGFGFTRRPIRRNRNFKQPAPADSDPSSKASTPVK